MDSGSRVGALKNVGSRALGGCDVDVFMRGFQRASLESQGINTTVSLLIPSYYPGMHHKMELLQ